MQRKEKHRNRVLRSVNGTLSTAAGGFGFVNTEDGTEIFIPPSAMNGALDGDTVRAEISPVKTENYDTAMLGMSEEESNFREIIEERERFNLSLGKASVSSDDFYHFYVPLEGVVTNRFDEGTRHYGVDVVTKPNTNVLSVLDGVVIFTDWTLKTGFVIQVQHDDNLISIYKHNSVLLKKQGDFVRAGEAIAIVGDTGEESSGPHLHFEIWKAGKPLDPESLLQFK